MSAKNETKKAKRGVGRPAAKLIDPANAPKGCTFADLCEAQGMRWAPRANDGKGAWTGGSCTPLTVRHHLPTALSKGKDSYGRMSRYFLTGETVAPDSKKGLGRKQFVFKLRANVEPNFAGASTPAKTRKLRKAATSTVTVPVVDIPATPAPTPVEALETKLAAIDAEAAAPAPAPAPEAPAETPAAVAAPATAEPVTA